MYRLRAIEVCVYIVFMSAETPPFLGQDLMRAAFKAGSLEPFEIPAEVMRDQSLPPLDRANAFKAISFGLPGIAIDGWARHVTQQVDTSDGLSFAFVQGGRSYPGARTLHDYLKVTHQRGPHVLGRMMLDNLQTGLLTSARRYMSPGSGQEVHGIPVGQVMSKLVDYGLEAMEDMDLLQVPMLSRGRQQSATRLPFVDFMNVASNAQDPHGEIGRVVANAAGNPVRFLKVPLNAIMANTVGRAKGAFNISGVSDLSPRDIDAVITDLLAHNNRVSQRADAEFSLIDDTVDRAITLERADTGKIRIGWLGRFRPPAPRVHPSQRGTTDREVEIVLDRQKCPAGYTVDPLDASGPKLGGLDRVAGAITHYLRTNLLNVPEVFMLEQWDGRS